MSRVKIDEDFESEGKELIFEKQRRTLWKLLESYLLYHKLYLIRSSTIWSNGSVGVFPFQNAAQQRLKIQSHPSSSRAFLLRVQL
jgi:hypothetical protein